MKIEQFEDKGLAHFSYAVLSECARAVVLVDPARDPQPYYDFAQAHGASIVAVIETHPHADFVSSHLEIAEATGAVIRVSQLLGAEYPHLPFDEGQAFTVGQLTFRALNTPGHSPDSISIVLSRAGHDVAVFTGDTLFVGDVGRPDLREAEAAGGHAREELARQLYRALHTQLLPLADAVLVYPAHGAGSLCGKALREATRSTIGAERVGNPLLRPLAERDFVAELLSGQPFVPKYFGYDVALNKAGAPPLAASLSRVPRLAAGAVPPPGALVIDARPAAAFGRGHLAGALNIQPGGKFETWLGSVVGPDEPFYLLAADEPALAGLLRQAAKIGYEALIRGAGVAAATGVREPALDVAALRAQPRQFTIVDVRSPAEARQAPLLPGALNLPLPELRERVGEIPTGRPVVVHCAGGYRSAAGSSIVAAARPELTVFDLGEAVQSFSTLASISA